MKLDKNQLKKVRNKALEYDKYSGCSQAVLLALQEEFNIGNIESFKSATVLSGGIARHEEGTCGAVIGALMALGLVIGRENMKNTEVYSKAMEPADKIIKRFKESIKLEFEFYESLETTRCREIHRKIFDRTFDMNDDQEYQEFLDAGGHTEEGCPKVCGIAAEIAAEEIMYLIDE